MAESNQGSPADPITVGVVDFPFFVQDDLRQPKHDHQSATGETTIG